MPRSLGAMPPPSPPARYPIRGLDSECDISSKDGSQQTETQHVFKLQFDSDREHDVQVANAGEEDSDNRRTIEKQAVELEDLRQQILELKELLSVQANATIKQNSFSISKKGKKKTNKVKDCKIVSEQPDDQIADMSHGLKEEVNPIVNELHNYLKVTRQQKQIEEINLTSAGTFYGADIFDGTVTNFAMFASS